MLQSTLNDRLQSMLEKKLVGYEKQLKNVYKEAYAEIEKELLYLNSQDKLNYKELLKRNRLNDLKIQIDNILKGLGQREIVVGLKDMVQSSYYSQCFEIAAASYQNITFSVLDPVTIEAAVYHSDMTINIIKTFQTTKEWKQHYKSASNTDSFLKSIFDKNNKAQKITVWNTLNKGLIQGSSYQSMAKDIKKVFQGGYNDAMRVLRTEGHKCQSIGQLASIEYSKEHDLDIREFWIATRDNRTRHSHKQMNRKFINDEGFFILPSGAKTKAPGLSGIAAEDINCRCGLGTSVDGIMPDEKETINPNNDSNKFNNLEDELAEFTKKIKSKKK